MKSLFIYILLILLSAATLDLFQDFPFIGLLIVELIFCFYCTSLFKSRWAFLILLYPFLTRFLYIFFSVKYLDLGDGPAYINTIKYHLPFYNNDQTLDSVILAISQTGYNYISFPFVPNILIPDFFFNNPSDQDYYSWQYCFNLILVSINITLMKKWLALPEPYLLSILLFSTISPSFLEYGYAPTRHFFTFFSVLLFFTAFHALLKQFSISRVSFLLIAIICIIFSKLGYFIPIIIYVIFTFKDNIKKIYLLIVGLSILPFLPFIISSALNYVNDYEGTSKIGVRSTGYLIDIPILGYFFKYLFAILSPFPWSKVDSLVTEVYGENYMFFICHVFSAITGLYFFIRLITHFKKLNIYDPQLGSLLVFGLIMSTSIIAGATGFHTYLVIFYPFFAPLLVVKKYNISLLLPIVIPIVAEIVLSFLVRG